MKSKIIKTNLPEMPEKIDSIEIETDLSTKKKYMCGLKLNQVEEILIDKINLLTFFINDLLKK